MSEWYNCPKCGTERENLCACLNSKCEDYAALATPPTATKDELALIRSLQHFYCDHIVDGVPTGDWHIERTPEQAARLLRTYVASEVAKRIARFRKLPEQLRSAGGGHGSGGHDELRIFDLAAQILEEAIDQ